MPQLERFWFGHISDNRGGSIVIWDRLAPALPGDQVYLYHFKRNTIVKFKRDLVRTRLRSIDQADRTVAGAALSAYFRARAKLSQEQATERQAREKQVQESETDQEKDEENEEVRLFKELLDKGRVCYSCDGRGYEHGLYGAIACAVCLGWGRLTF